MRVIWKTRTKAQAYCTVAIQEAQLICGDNSGLIRCDGIKSALSDECALIAIVKWSAFRIPSLNGIRELRNSSLIIDGQKSL